MAYQYYRGFTVAEVLIVVAILSILSAGFLSTNIINAFQRWQVHNALNQDVQMLLTGITRARNLAVTSQHSIYLCGGQECDGDWSQLISLRMAESLTDINRWQLALETKMVWRGFPASRQYIEFLPNGLSSYQNGSFYLCYNQEMARRILINQSGRAYLDTTEYSAEVCQ